MISIVLSLGALVAQTPSAQGFAGTPAGKTPKVEIAWNRFYDVAGLYGLMDRLEAAHPELVSHRVIGLSVESRELRVYTLHQPKTGKDVEKPAMWIDGNVHGNEVQGGEAVVYTAWYLLENYGSNPKVTELVDGSTFYFLPTVNPDGRDSWFHDAHDASSSRSGRRPIDDDQDGVADEDGADDLDGDGHIGQMWKFVPGQGTHRRNVDDPRIFEPVPPNEFGIRGDWLSLGEEGVDDDGDGRTNEDDAGGYDMNRAWPSMWAPDFVQYGAGPYPLYWPETRAIARFLLEHPNVAALQSFHNNGGMILRGPGAQEFGEYPAEDVRVFDAIGRDGERMLPFYKYMVIWKDLYTVWGGFATWGYEGLGVISFTNEMWSSDRLFPTDSGGENDRASFQKKRFAFNDLLMSGDAFIDWHPVRHPFYGEVLVGGFKKDWGRVPPSFMIEEEAHRNALFCLKHAAEMPKVVVEELVVVDLGDGLFAVDATFANRGAIPTRTEWARRKSIGAPDVFTLRGAEIEVLASGTRTDRWRPERLELVEREPARIVSERGIRGDGRVQLRWLVRGKGEFEVEWRGEKARACRGTGRL
ncbi:MAG: M14 family metallopeptidase [Planctomycetes bacterium]|nr:M14 family metallopeptidase [Planctomycetota bacterium]